MRLIGPPAGERQDVGIVRQPQHADKPACLFGDPGDWAFIEPEYLPTVRQRVDFLPVGRGLFVPRYRRVSETLAVPAIPVVLVPVRAAAAVERGRAVADFQAPPDGPGKFFRCPSDNRCAEVMARSTSVIRSASAVS